MEFIVELVLDLFVEGGIEVSSNKKISKWVRYPIAAILILFFSSIIFGLIFAGILSLKNSLVGGILIIVVGLLMLGTCIYKFRKTYLEQVKK